MLYNENKTTDTKLTYLDIFIKRNDNEVWMDIHYFKPTDTRCRCLSCSYSVPSHCKKTIPKNTIRKSYHIRKSYFSRYIYSIVENRQGKLRHLLQLKENLKNITTSSV